MGREIERKFLVTGGWPKGDGGTPCVQGYIPVSGACGVRIRVIGDRARVTFKGPSVAGSRLEYEYPIPIEDAQEMLEAFCLKPLIEKTRHEVVHAGRTWEVDVFHGANQGLVLAEIELSAIDEPVDLPDWVGEEVTGCPEYHNFSLVRHPWQPGPAFHQSRKNCR
jgi:adenylate cyclase